MLAGAALALIGLALLTQPGTMRLLGWSMIALGATSTLSSLFVVPAHVRAWSIGAVGEELVGHLLDSLEPEGFRVFHDLRRPGGRDNIDHLLIGPPGVIIVETKHYAGSVRVRGGELHLRGRRHPEIIEQVRRQIASVETALDVNGVIAMICVVEGEFPWFGSTRLEDVEILPPDRLAKSIRSVPRTHMQGDLDRLLERASHELRSA